jgi:predicted dehydrogenase
MRRSLQLSILSVAFVFALLSRAAFSQSTSDVRTRLAIVGLDHDHVWGMLTDIAAEPQAELVAIADPRRELAAKAKSRVPATVKFYDDYVKMLDEEKPEAVIVTTENGKHLAILRECAKRHIHYSTEKPMATTGADAREMERLAREAHIKLMVNYWNAWVAPTHDLFHRVFQGDLGPVQKMIVQQGHQGPKEIGVSKEFEAWLYDPAKNGGGAIMDFGSYGAEWALWLKGRPTRVYACTLKLKTAQHNEVDDDATILLEYPDGTAVIQASWDWPRDKGQVEVYGPKGSLLATQTELFFQPPAGTKVDPKMPDGALLQLQPVPHETSNPISYFVDCIRNDKPIENPVAAELNVGVVEILDAARESARTGRPVKMPAR